MHATGNNSNNVLLVSHLHAFNYRHVVHVLFTLLHWWMGALCYGAVVKLIMLSRVPQDAAHNAGQKSASGHHR